MLLACKVEDVLLAPRQSIKVLVSVKTYQVENFVSIPLLLAAVTTDRRNVEHTRAKLYESSSEVLNFKFVMYKRG